MPLMLSYDYTSTSAQEGLSMIVRIWRTEIEPARASEYLEFTRNYSVPMFRRQQGFIGVFFAARETERAVITLWQGMGAVKALDESDTYARIVAAIEAAGFLRGAVAVSVFEVENGYLDASVLDFCEDAIVLGVDKGKPR